MARILEAAGLARESIVIDPGFGFGKTLAHNLSLLRHLDAFVDTGYPVLAGMSRKSMIGAMLDTPVDDVPPGGRAHAAGRGDPARTRRAADAGCLAHLCGGAGGGIATFAQFSSGISWGANISERTAYAAKSAKRR